MSIKTELRLIEQKQFEIKNSKFDTNTNYWSNTGTTDWNISQWNNTAVSSTGSTTQLYQTLSTQLDSGRTYVLEYQVVNNSGNTITPSFGGVSLTPRVVQGKYKEIIPTGVTYTNNNLGFDPDVDFSGGVTNVKVYGYEYDEYGIQLYDDLSYNLNFQVFDIGKIDDRSATYSKTIKIPGTAVNNKIFSHLYDIDIEIDQSLAISNSIKETFFNKRIDCELLYDTIPIKEGFFELQSAYYNESLRQIEYEGVFYSKGKTFAENLGDKLLTGNRDINDDLDFSMYDHLLSVGEVIKSQDDTGPYYNTSTGFYYPIIDYVNKETSNNVTIEEIRPAIYVKEIIDKIFEDAGFNYQSTFFDSEFFKTLVMPWTGEVSLDQEDLELRNLKVTTSDYFTGYGSVIWGNTTWGYEFRDLYNDNLKSGNKATIKQVPFNVDSPDPWYNSSNNDFNTTTYNWLVPAKGEYDIQYTPTQQIYGIQWRNGGVAGLCFSDGDKSVDVFFGLYKIKQGTTTPILVKEVKFQQYYPTVGGDTWTAPFTGSLSYSGLFDKGDIVYTTLGILNKNNWYDTGSVPVTVRTWLYSHPNLTAFEVTARPSYELLEGEMVEMNRCLTEGTKQIDFFKGIANMFNLIVDEHREKDNTLIIETRDDYYSSGTTQDWSDKEDITNFYEISRIETLIDKDFEISYTKDTDTYNTTYTEELVPGRVYGDHIIKNPYKSSGIYKIESSFSPTPLGRFGYSNWVISKIYEVNARDETVQRTFNPRILQRQNIPDDVPGMSNGLLSGWILSSGSTIRYGNSLGESRKASNTYTFNFQPYAGHLDNPYHPTKDLNFYYCGKYMYDVFFDESGYTFEMTDNNVYLNYWKNYISELMDINSKKVVKFIKLDITDIYKLNFANTILINGVLYTLLSIKDWNPGQITEVELLKLNKTDLNNDVRPSTSNMKGKMNIIKKKTSRVFESLPYEPSIDLTEYSGTTMISGSTSNDWTGVTYTTYTPKKNNYNEDGYGIIIGGDNIISSNDFFIKGDNNIVQSGNTNVSILGSNVRIDTNDLNNIFLVGNFSGQTITESNKLYLGSGTTIDGYSNKLETEVQIYDGITASGVTQTYLTSNYYNTGETYTQTEITTSFASKGGNFSYFQKTTQGLSAGDYYIIGDDYNGTGRTITLMTSYTISGKVYLIQDEIGNAAANNITIQTEGLQTINGSSTKTISNNYGTSFLYCDGSNWFGL